MAAAALEASTRFYMLENTRRAVFARNKKTYGSLSGFLKLNTCRQDFLILYGFICICMDLRSFGELLKGFEVIRRIIELI